MNKILLGALSFLGGATVGGLVTFKFVRDYYSKEAEKEIEEVREWARKIRSESKKLEEGDDSEGEETEKVEERPSHSSLDRSRTGRRSTNIDYTKFFKSPEKPDPEEFMKKYNENAEKEHPEEEDEPKIYLLDESEIALLGTGSSGMVYELETLTWYNGDATLADPKEEMIDDISQILGDEAAEILYNLGPDDPTDVIYVRNERMGMDFEIVIDDRSYSEYVLGIRSDDEDDE